MIKRIHGGYTLFNREGTKVLGKHATREAAQAQETAINLSKARAAGDRVPPPPKKSKK